MFFFGIIFPTMESKTHNILNAVMTKIMRPLVRILLRNGIPFRQFSELIKWVYVDVALKEFTIAGRKQTDSRVSVITGLSRKDVRQLKKLKPPSDRTEIENYNRAARVISGWKKDPEFTNAKGQPMALNFNGQRPSFSQLVKKYSGDVPPRSVLDEMKQVGSVAVFKNGKIHLRTAAYIPNGDQPAMLSILGTDVSDLAKTIDWNLRAEKSDRFFQRKVAYDNVPVESAAIFRKFSAEESQNLLDKFDKWLSSRDRDTNPAIEGSGRIRSGMGIYYFEEKIE